MDIEGLTVKGKAFVRYYLEGQTQKDACLLSGLGEKRALQLIKEQDLEKVRGQRMLHPDDGFSLLTTLAEREIGRSLHRYAVDRELEDRLELELERLDPGTEEFGRANRDMDRVRKRLVESAHVLKLMKRLQTTAGNLSHLRPMEDAPAEEEKQTSWPV